MKWQFQACGSPEMLQVRFAKILMPECVTCVQDILSRFNGNWSLQPILNEEETHVIGTRAVLEQDILPAGAAL